MNIKIKQNIPNIISITRIILSISIPILYPHKAICISIYILAGITDILDGFLARHLNATTQIGAKLDTLGDFIFSLSIITSLLIFRQKLINSFLGWIILVFIIRISTYIINGIKNKNFTSIHTIANKIAGFTIYIFLIPILMDFESPIAPFLIITVTLLSALEELILVTFFHDINPNCKSLWHIIKHSK